jgi:protein-L-isoaspartate(D-aspartate) O-methyltransferase
MSKYTTQKSLDNTAAASEKLLNQTSSETSKERSRDRLIAELIEKGIRNNAVLEAIARVPRHAFVEEGFEHQAYNDTTLPIGQGQTISQPYVVAKMTELAFVGSKVKNILEVGTGCGYQTSILAQLGARICTIERIRSLQVLAEQRLRALGLRNIEYRHGDGFVGWKSRAPFDAIVVTAGSDSVPDMLLQQLAQGGRLVMPVGQGNEQRLLVVKRQGDNFVEESRDFVKFVPLLRGVIE